MGGFNPLHLSKSDRHILLNPIVGPEAVCGSTRMKGGSCTLLLLQIIFFIALIDKDKNLKNKQMNELIFDLLTGYEAIYRQSYQNLNSLQKICKMTADCLQSSDGKVCYFGNGNAQSIMALIDASEMWPTFGTKLNRFRSYFDGGWHFIKNKDGDLRQNGDAFKIDSAYFNNSCLTSNDLMIFVGANEQSKKLKNAKCKIVSIAIKDIDDDNDDNDDNDNDFVLKIKFVKRIKCCNESLMSLLNDFYKMFAMKLLLNAVSTSSHILSGNVLNNRMVNVRVSNQKLFKRAIGIIEHFGNVTFEMAKLCLLQSIYGDDEYQNIKSNDSVSKHILSATNGYKIVPVAILLASQISKHKKEKKSVHQIRNLLKNEPS